MNSHELWNLKHTIPYFHNYCWQIGVYLTQTDTYTGFDPAPFSDINHSITMINACHIIAYFDASFPFFSIEMSISSVEMFIFFAFQVSNGQHGNVLLVAWRVGARRGFRRVGPGVDGEPLVISELPLLDNHRNMVFFHGIWWDLASGYVKIAMMHHVQWVRMGKSWS